MRLASNAQLLKYLVSSWYNYLGSIRRYELIGGGVSLEIVFEISKDSHHSQCALCFLLLDQDVISLFLLLCLCSPIMDSKLIKS